jgi:hypothetical protein
MFWLAEVEDKNPKSSINEDATALFTENKWLLRLVLLLLLLNWMLLRR